jgi:hypothetical protein
MLQMVKPSPNTSAVSFFSKLFLQRFLFLKVTTIFATSIEKRGREEGEMIR